MGFFDWISGFFGSNKDKGAENKGTEDNIGSDIGKGLKGGQDYYGKGGALDVANQAMREQDERDENERKERAAEAAAERARLTAEARAAASEARSQGKEP